jgi:hypothetical protein
MAFPLDPNTPPNGQVWIDLPNAPGGRNRITLSTQKATAEYFRLFELSDPVGLDSADGDYLYRRDPGRTRTQNTGWYRIAYAPNPSGNGTLASRFRLSSGHTRATLAYLSDHINSTGVDWLWLTNAHGNPLSRSAFRSDALMRAAA